MDIFNFQQKDYKNNFVILTASSLKQRKTSSVEKNFENVDSVHKHILVQSYLNIAVFLFSGVRLIIVPGNIILILNPNLF